MGRKGTGNRAGENVLCPLFIAFTEKELMCHSHVLDASSVILKYSDRTTCERQRKLFCEGCWEKCEHYLSWKHWCWEDD